MIIEWLKVRVSPGLREKYIKMDAEIWTSELSKYPGFLGKEVWLNPEIPEEVVLVIRWETRREWKSISQKSLDLIEEKFDEQMEDQDYQIIESKEYQVRKFPQVST